jgi:hypothetical protein
MLQLQSIPAAAQPGGHLSIPWWGCVWFMIVGGGGLIVVYRFASSGVIRVRRSGSRIEYRRDDDPGRFWAHVLGMAAVMGLFFLLGLIGLIWKLFHLHGVA